MPRQLGYYLISQRIKAGMTQQQVATRAGISRVYLSAIEAGQRVPPAPVMTRLAAALGMDEQAIALVEEWADERRRTMRPLRSLFRRNPELVDLLSFLGDQALSDEERRRLGAAVGAIVVARRHLAQARRPVARAAAYPQPVDNSPGCG
jgi:transcriptional regulator with XRE-family HTH domain